MYQIPLVSIHMLKNVDRSELHAIMTGGFATVAGTVLAAFIGFGIDAATLISASFMAAPAALGVSKLFYPETERSLTTMDNIELPKVNGILTHD